MQVERLGDQRVTADRRSGVLLNWLWSLFNRRRGERRDGFGRRRRVAMERKDDI